MSERTYKVGDVVAWDEVPDGALVRHHGSSQLHPGHALRVQGQGTWAEEQGEWYPWAGMWPWAAGGDGEVTIIALDLTGKETAAELQRLAEVYEVREAVADMLVCQHCGNMDPSVELFDDGTCSQPWCTECDSEMGTAFDEEDIERLHAAKWRRGMTAEDAARLLAEADDIKEDKPHKDIGTGRAVRAVKVSK